MKKLYFLFLLLTPFFVNAQTWDFNGSNGDWTGGSSTVTNNGTSLVMSFIASETTPKIINLSAGVDSSTKTICAITLKNNSLNSYLRVSHLKSSGTGRAYVNIDITPNDTGFKTYYFEMTSSNWSGTEDDIQIHLKATSSTNNSTIGNVEFDKIEFLASIPAVQRQSYHFDTDNDSEGWNKLNGSISGPTSGVLTFSPTADKFAKLALTVDGPYYVSSSLASSVTISLTNLSTNDDQLRIIVDGQSIPANDLTISTEDTTEKTYSFLLTNYTGWTGNVQGIEFAFRDSDNTNGAGKSSGTGDFLINSIVFDNTLEVDDVDFKDDTSISLYPNPVQNVLRVKASSSINKIEIYNILGQNVLSIENSNAINVQHLNKGAYISKIFQDNNVVSTKRFFKD